MTTDPDIFIVVQDCWRWTLLDKDGRFLGGSDHAFESREQAFEDLKNAQVRVDHPGLPVVEQGR